MSNLIGQILLMVFIPFAFVAVIMPFIMKIAVKVGAVDIPRGRHIHKKPTPKLGGLAIFFGFLLGYMIFGEHSEQMNSVLIGSFAIVITGMIDDICELKPKHKLIGQVVAACIITFYGKILLVDVSAFGFYLNFGILTYPITVLFIIACINCINLIDGLDGLSGGISAIYYLTIGIIGAMVGKLDLEFVLTFVMLGSTLGFLVHNFYPAKIFAGDTGSMFMGFIIAVIALLGFKNVTMTSLIIPLLILAIPILDTLFAIIRRALKGEKIYEGDAYHVHHQLLNRNFSQRTTVLIIYFINLLFAFASIVYIVDVDNKFSYCVYGLLAVIVILFIWNTNIIFDRKDIKKKFKKKWKKRILFCSYSLDIGGIETGLINLLNNMDYNKYHVDLILERREGALFERLNKNVNVIEYRVSESNNVIFRKIHNFCKRFLWIICNYHRYSFSCCFATYSMPCNVLSYYASSNNSLYVHSNYKYIYDEGNLRKFFDIRRINKFKHVIFVSNEAKDDLINFYPCLAKNSLVINNLINYEEVLWLSNEKVSFNKTDNKLFVFVGRLEERAKKISRMIEVVKRIPNVDLLIVGDGPDYDMYKEMSSDCDRIIFIGSKKNPYPYMKLADYVVISSDYEGFPVVYSEAIVLNKKIITTIDVSDDFISIPNRFGYIVSKNTDQMVKDILDILSGKELDYENVDFNKINSYKIKKLEDIIEEVV